MTGVPPKGWHVEVDHPTGRTITPSIAAEPKINPKINGYPYCRVPVPKDDMWQSDRMRGRVTMRVWIDGKRQPIEELVDVEAKPDRYVLVGKGGVELEQRFRKEYSDRAAHLAVQDAINSQTSYNPDVDDPDTNRSETLVQEASSSLEWENNIPFEPGGKEPVYVENGELRLAPVSFFIEAEDFMSGTTVTEVSGSQYSNGKAVEVGSFFDDSWSFPNELKHRIDSSNWELWMRFGNTSGAEDRNFNIYIEGVEILNAYDPGGDGWEKLGGGTFDLQEGTISGRIEEFTQVDAGSHSWHIDCIALVDTRFSFNFDENPNSSGYLSGPSPYKPFAKATGDAGTSFSIVGGRLESSWNNITGAQRVEISPDQGGTWYTANNSTSVEKDFPSTSRIRARFRLDGYGQRSGPTPTQDFNGQHVDSYRLYADTAGIPRLINQRYDDSLMNFLKNVADYGNFIFQVVHDGQEITIVWTKVGQRQDELESGPINYSVNRSEEHLYKKVTVIGSARPISQEEVNANHDFPTELAEDWLVAGSELVRQGQQIYDEGVDYEMDYENGTITTLQGGSITDGTIISVDYRFEVRNEASIDSFDPGTDKELVRKIPGLVTESSCKQAALFLLNSVSEPFYTANVTIDKPQDASRALVDDVLIDGVPTNDTRMTIQSIDQDSQKAKLTLGSRDSIDEIVGRIESRLGSTERRV